jgi:hypothetical protein
MVWTEKTSEKDARRRNKMIEAKVTNPKADEVASLHYANVLYWRGGAVQSREARAEYQRRQDRLREIRAFQLAQIPFETLGSV